LNPQRHYPIHLLLLIALTFSLAACGDDEDKNTSLSNSAVTVAPTVRPTVTRPIVDPGPYFSPGRPLPTEDPATYQGPEQVGDFQRTNVSGQANLNTGVTAIYSGPEDGRIVLNIYYMVDNQTAYSLVEQMGTATRLDGPPEYLVLDENTSYTLYQMRDGRTVYAWTHDQWAFIATSSTGRPSLDAFMREFPY
jgi:hypothetical protein